MSLSPYTNISLDDNAVLFLAIILIESSSDEIFIPHLLASKYSSSLVIEILFLEYTP